MFAFRGVCAVCVRVCLAVRCAHTHASERDKCVFVYHLYGGECLCGGRKVIATHTHTHASACTRERACGKNIKLADMREYSEDNREPAAANQVPHVWVSTVLLL